MIEIKVRKETRVVLRRCSQEALDSFGSLRALKVNGDLDLMYCAGHIKFPDNLIVAGDLDLWSCLGLTELPDGLNVDGSLDLYNCAKLTRLPDGLVVMGRLDLRYCAGITMLPEDLQVEGIIYYNSETGFYGHEDELGVIPDHLKNKLMKF
jgi:hypothetical protein